jgi:hypothetical protein
VLTVSMLVSKTTGLGSNPSTPAIKKPVRAKANSLYERANVILPRPRGKEGLAGPSDNGLWGISSDG